MKMFLTSVLNSVCSAMDSLIYTGLAFLMSSLHYPVESRLLRQLFTVEMYGAQEKGKCVYLTNYVHRVSTRLAFASPPKYLTDDPEQALAWSRETGYPIQTVVSYGAREYFDGWWVRPQPYPLVYEYGTVDLASDASRVSTESGADRETKTAREYAQYFFDKLGARPSVRLYDPQNEQSRLVLLALLCSRWPILSVYLLLRYQWYNRVCFEALLIGVVAFGLLA
jgi:hypothetical protein